MPIENEASMRQICAKDETMVCMPMLDSIAQLLPNKQIFEMVISHPPEHDNDTLYGICDWERYKHNPIFQQHKNTLEGMFYYDEVEI